MPGLPTAASETMQPPIHHLPFLNGIPKESVLRDLPCFQHFPVGPGEVLVQQGEVDDALLVVVQGQVAVEVGDPALEVARAGPGEVLGETALFRPAWRREATLRTASPCSILVLDGPGVEHLRENRSEVLAALERHALKSIGLRLRRVSMQAPAEALPPVQPPSDPGLAERFRRWFKGETSASAGPAPSADAVLAKAPGFNLASPEARAALAEMMEMACFGPDTILVEGTAVTSALQVLASGEVELRDPRGDEHEQKVLARLSPGAILDPLAQVHGNMGSARCVSTRPGWVMQLPRERSLALIGSTEPAGGALRAALYEALFSDLVARNSAWYQRWRAEAA